ncbi:sigma-70 family RNA polymerase sigma factor, partial [bacterium]|nr:sigma-70 family RNA polymerase sigma factor [bacterium]
MKRPELPDSTLIENYKKSNDHSCLAELYQRYNHLVFGVCLKYLKNEDASKDAAMEIFVKLTGDLKKT